MDTYLQLEYLESFMRRIEYKNTYDDHGTTHQIAKVNSGWTISLVIQPGKGSPSGFTKDESDARHKAKVTNAVSI